jgi:hypothetical protein
MGTLPSAKPRFHEFIRQANHGEQVRTLELPHVLNLLDELADCQEAAGRSGRVAVLVKRRKIAQIQKMLALPWAARFAVGAFAPFGLRAGLVELFQVREFLLGP